MKSLNVIIVGCGRMGSELAHRLFQQGHQVVVVDENPQSFNLLPPDFRGRTVPGDALNQGVLERAGIKPNGKPADALVATTASDSVNVVLAQIARQIYHVPHVVARNYDVHFRALYEMFGIQVVSSIAWSAQRIEEMIYHANLRIVFSAGNGEVEIYEVLVPSRWEGCLIQNMLPPDCAVVALTRGGRAILPHAQSTLLEGDLLHVSANLQGANALAEALAKVQTEE